MEINSSKHISTENSIYDIVISIILGLIFGIISGYIIFNQNKYIGPDSNEIVKHVYFDEKGKYKFKPRITICPLNYSMNKLHQPNFKESH